MIKIPVIEEEGNEYGVYEIEESWRGLLAIYQYVSGENIEEFKMKCSPPFHISKVKVMVRGEEFKLKEGERNLLKGGRFLLYPSV